MLAGLGPRKLMDFVRVRSGDSWMYPDPNVPRHGKSLYKHYIVGIYGLYSLRIHGEHNKYNGYIVRGTPNCPLRGGLNSRQVSCSGGF